jgi:hypothetical protein
MFNKYIRTCQTHTVSIQTFKGTHLIQMFCHEGKNLYVSYSIYHKGELNGELAYNIFVSIHLKTC